MDCRHSHGFSALACDHAVHPRNYGPLKDFDAHARITGPCGDTMEFWLAVGEGRLQRVSFTTDGCESSLACGSMATSMATGKRIEDAAAIEQRDILDALGEFPPEFAHCALLAANTLKEACQEYLKRQAGSPSQPPGAQVAYGSREDRDCPASKPRENESNEQYLERRELQFLGSIPIDPNIADACESGSAFVPIDAANPSRRL